MAKNPGCGGAACSAPGAAPSVAAGC